MPSTRAARVLLPEVCSTTLMMWRFSTSASGSFSSSPSGSASLTSRFRIFESSAVLRKLLAETSEDELLQLPLAEVEKRHILRVLSSTNGNKTRAARILGIDTKTLYNKLKSYKSSEQVARKRIAAQGVI